MSETQEKKGKPLLINKTRIIFFLKLSAILIVTALIIGNYQGFFDFGNTNTTEEFVNVNLSNPITKKEPVQILFDVSKNGIKEFQFPVFAPESGEDGGFGMKFEIRSIDEFVTDDSVFTIKKLTGQTLQSTIITADDIREANQYIFLPITVALKTGTSYSIHISSEQRDADNAYRLQVGSAERTDITSWYSGINKGSGTLEINIIYGGIWWIYYAIMFLYLAAAAALTLLPSLPTRKLKLIYHFILLFATPLAVLHAGEKLNFNSITLIRPGILFFNYLLILFIYILIYAITNRFSISVMVTSVFLLILATINHFVLMFRANVFLPGDIYGLSAAVNVATGYTFSFTPPILHALVLIVFLVCAATRDFAVIKNKKYRISTAAFSVAYSILVVIGVSSPDFYGKTGIALGWWRQTSGSKANGFYSNFAINIPQLVISPPSGYQPKTIPDLIGLNPAVEYESAADIQKDTDDRADKKEITNEQDSADESGHPADNPVDFFPVSAGKEDGNGSTVQPSIITIMNESFTDPFLVGDLPTNEDPLRFVHTLALDDNPRTFVGNVVVPVYGASTNCSEFEMLTGFSISLHKTISPFGQFVHHPTSSLASKLSELGYHTIASHPADGSNWDRDRTFPLLGFQDSFFEEDFGERERSRGHISDKGSFDFIIEQFESKDERPQFHYNLTIENHGGYNISPPEEDTIFIEGTGHVMASTEEYLTGLSRSDAAFEYLISYFETVDEPVLIVMFGDHWGAADDWFLTLLFGTERPNFTKWQTLQLHTTPLIMWANYDVDFSWIPEYISSNYLSTAILESAELPMTPFDTFLRQGIHRYPVFSSFGYIDSNGKYYEDLPKADADFKKTYEILQYNGLFDTKKRIEELFNYQSNPMSGVISG